MADEGRKRKMQRKKEANLMKNLFKKIGALLVAAVMVLSMCTAVFAATKDTATITVMLDEQTKLTTADLNYAQVIVADQTTKTGWAFIDETVGLDYINAFVDDKATKFDADKAQNAIKQMIPKESVDTNKLGLAQAKAANHVHFVHMSNPQSVSRAGVYLVKATEAKYTYNIMSAYIGFDKVTIEEEGNQVTYDYPSLADAIIIAKRTEMKVTKELTAGDNAGDHVVANGDILTYTVKTNVPYIAPTDTDKTFWVYDELTGAEYTETESATITLAGAATTGYTINWNKPESGKFNVDLTGMINAANSNAGKEVVITYKVKVTAENDEITNTATAGHKDKNTYGSDKVELYEGNITLTKTNDYKTKNEKVLLAGAGFEVRKDSETSTALNFKKTGEGEYLYVKAPITNDKGNVITTTEIVTNTDGTVKIKGLDIGTYYFKEITAPKGYSVRQDSVNATLGVTTENGKDGVAIKALTATTEMKDTKLSALPSTGGMGTYLFTIIGVVVMAGAAGAFFISRRKGSEE